MKKKSITKIAPEDLPIKQSDINSGKLILRKRNNQGQILPQKKRVNIYLDDTIIQHFKKLAGARGYQTLINEALKNILQVEAINSVIRKTIREELRRH